MPKKTKTHELVIIGAGPAGLTASIYASRYMIEHVVIGSQLGGVITETHLIDNYPGIENVTGYDFAQKLAQHTQKYEVKIISQPVLEIKKRSSHFEIQLANREKITSQAVLIATGKKRRQLGLKGEEKLLGKGVSYCATCDGFFYKNKVVAVIGGNDSALGAAIYLAEIAKLVFLIYRRSELRAEPYWIEKLKGNKKIKLILNTQIVEFLGDKKLAGIKIIKQPGDIINLKVQGVFIEIGSEPNIEFASQLGIETDEKGLIKIKNNGTTNVMGIWSAGDITNGSDKFNQVITAAAEGAIAVHDIHRYLKKS